MLKMYLVSVIIYLIIFKATESVAKFIMNNRKDINYKEYLSGDVKGKISMVAVSLIPLLRTLFLVIMLYVMFADKESLDKLFKKSEEK